MSVSNLIPVLLFQAYHIIVQVMYKLTDGARSRQREQIPVGHAYAKVAIESDCGHEQWAERHRGRLYEKEGLAQQQAARLVQHVLHVDGERHEYGADGEVAEGQH